MLKKEGGEGSIELLTRWLYNARAYGKDAWVQALVETAAASFSRSASNSKSQTNNSLPIYKYIYTYIISIIFKTIIQNYMWIIMQLKMSYPRENFTFFLYFCFNSKIFAFFILFCIIRKFHEIMKKKESHMFSHRISWKNLIYNEKILSRCCNTYYWSYDTTSTV